MSRGVGFMATIAHGCKTAVAAGLVIAFPAYAAAATCSSIEAELSALRHSSAPTSGKWQTAKDQQEQAIVAAERDARYFRCSTAPSSAKCQGLTSKIDRMRKNLRAIERKIGQQTPGGSRTARRIRQLERMHQSQKCSVQATQNSSAGPGGLLAKIFDNSHTTSAPAPDTRYRTLPNGLVVQVPKTGLLEARSTGQQLAALGSQVRLNGERLTQRGRLPSGGTFRTLCVRTCDGYFFPVSFSTGRDQFVNDAARCGEICPAATTELFVHRNPGGMQEEMMSLQGVPYLETENAYRFQTEFVPGCTCRKSHNAGTTQSAMTPIGLSGDIVPDADGRLRVSLDPAGPSPFFGENEGENAEDGFGWGRLPMLSDHLPEGLDPATRQDLIQGFKADLLHLPMPGGTNDDGAADLAVSSVATPWQAQKDPDTSSASGPSEDPVFAGSDRADFKPRDDSGPIRVVGPEYFVAQ